MCKYKEIVASATHMPCVYFCFNVCSFTTCGPTLNQNKVKYLLIIYCVHRDGKSNMKYEYQQLLFSRVQFLQWKPVYNASLLLIIIGLTIIPFYNFNNLKDLRLLMFLFLSLVWKFWLWFSETVMIAPRFKARSTSPGTSVFACPSVCHLSLNYPSSSELFDLPPTIINVGDEDDA